MSTGTPGPRASKQPAAPTEPPPATDGLLPSVAPQDAPGAVPNHDYTYKVFVYTGSLPGAGTDGDIWLWVDDDKGLRSGWLYLDNSDDNFERNHIDYFELGLGDLRAPASAWVHFRPRGENSAWFLELIKINQDRDFRTFSYNNWIVNEGTYKLTMTYDT